jgi:hypothetical protein
MAFNDLNSNCHTFSSFNDITQQMAPSGTNFYIFILSHTKLTAAPKPYIPKIRSKMSEKNSILYALKKNMHIGYALYSVYRYLCRTFLVNSCLIDFVKQKCEPKILYKCKKKYLECTSSMFSFEFLLKRVQPCHIKLST